MMTSKSAQLSITLKSVALIKELSLGLAPIGCVAVRNFCNEISRTLINQAGEIDSLNAHAQNLATAYNSYEVHWDSLIFAIMGADAKADIIDSVDIERTTTAAIAAVKKLASQRDENQRIAEAFQTAANTAPKTIDHHIYKDGVHIGTVSHLSDAKLNAEKIFEDIQKTSKIGQFGSIFINPPKAAEETLFGCVVPARSESFAESYFGCQPTPKTHELKIAPEYLESVICGQKKSETRINDRDFKVNDRIILREWENDAYTGWVHEVVITHICDFPYVVTGDKWVSLSISDAYALDPDAIKRYLNSRATA